MGKEGTAFCDVRVFEKKKMKREREGERGREMRRVTEYAFNVSPFSLFFFLPTD